jgi:hypothetical protein
MAARKIIQVHPALIGFCGPFRSSPLEEWRSCSLNWVWLPSGFLALLFLAPRHWRRAESSLAPDSARLG